MSYVNVYLMSLGMSKTMLSMVWIAGPLSGLLMQPVIGVISDNSTSRYGRRRPYMVGGSVAVTLALLAMAWAQEITAAIPLLPESWKHVMTLVVATMTIFVTDFSINAVQACCRALIIDVLPQELQELGNGWAGRMIAVGHLLGYWFGAIDLVHYTGGWLGDTQLKSLCVISAAALLLSVGITCLSVQEEVFNPPMDEVSSKSSLDMVTQQLKNIYTTLRSTIRTLPPRISLILRVQLFAWYSWFSFLFYSSTWVGEVYYKYDYPRSSHPEQSADLVGEMARKGSMSLVAFSLVSLVSSLILPAVVPSTYSGRSGASTPRTLSRRLPASGNTLVRILFLICHIALAPVRFVIGSLSTVFRLYNLHLTDVWVVSHIVYALANFCTGFVTSLWGATMVVAACGFSWAITTWGPFALLGEEIRLLAERPSDEPDSRASSSGVYMGIHNMSITLPQFVATVVSFVVFSFYPTPETEPGQPPASDGGIAIARILQLGSVSTLIAAYYARKLSKESAHSGRD